MTVHCSSMTLIDFIHKTFIHQTFIHQTFGTLHGSTMSMRPHCLESLFIRNRCHSLIEAALRDAV